LPKGRGTAVALGESRRIDRLIEHDEFHAERR
jgi:hypothetical protein